MIKNTIGNCTDCTEVWSQTVPVIKDDNNLEQSSRAMNLGEIFCKDPLAETADLLKEHMITGHNLKVALLTLSAILSAKLNKPMAIIISVNDVSAGMKFLKHCMLLAPEEAYKEYGQLNCEDIFCDALGLNDKTIISLEPSGFKKTWGHLVKMLTMGYTTQDEVIQSKYRKFSHVHRVECFVSVVGIISDIKDKTYNHPAVMKLSLHENEYPLIPSSVLPTNRQTYVHMEVAMARLRETFARLRPVPVDISYIEILLNAIKAAKPSDPERIMQTILKLIAISCIINNPEPVTKEEIFSRIYNIDKRKLCLPKVSSIINQHPLDDSLRLTATKRDYYYVWLLLDDMIPVKEISLSDRQIKVFEVIKKINFGKLNNSFSENNVIKQLSQISTSSTYWARREKIFEEFNKNGHEEASQSTIYIELQHLIKEGLIAEDKYPKSTSKGYYVATFEAGKNIKLPHPSEIIDDEFKGEKLQVINPLTGEAETI